MTEIIDEFVLNYTLQQLQKQIEDNLRSSNEYHATNDSNLSVLSSRIGLLEQNSSESNGSLNSLIQLVNVLGKSLSDTIRELNKTMLTNIKQDIVIRTLHNMTFYSANDMFTDTFADKKGIDWDLSTRAELQPEYQAVGKTRQSFIVVQQPSAPSYTLISKNGTSDEAITQLFQIDKDRQIDKISLFVEALNDNTYQPLIISIRSAKDGSALTSADITPDKLKDGWVDIKLPQILLKKETDYYVDIRTPDIYGYKIGVDTTDRYMYGTSYNLFNSVWMDNNYDIGFKIYCFPSVEENDAFVYTYVHNYETVPTSIIFERDETIIEGSINYFVSRDSGSNWMILQPGIETNLDDLPKGKAIQIKAVVTGNSRINAWGYVIKRGDVE